MCENNLAITKSFAGVEMSANSLSCSTTGEIQPSGFHNSIPTTYYGESGTDIRCIGPQLRSQVT